jgi:hypothetical protein
MDNRGDIVSAIVRLQYFPLGQTPFDQPYSRSFPHIFLLSVQSNVSSSIY